jgi:hypothetical protein
MIILIVCGNVPILQPAYSQENAASTTTDSGPSQQESNITIKIVVFLIFVMLYGQFIKD